MKTLLTLIGSSLCWVIACAAGEPPKDDWLPLAKGNYWIYQGPTKWTSGDEIVVKILTWRMEITEVIRRGDGLTAAVVKGYPEDLAWYEPDKKPGDYLIVRVGAGKYYLLSGDEAAKMRKQFGKKVLSLQKLSDNEALLIDAPLTEGKHYGPAEQLKRNMYCWVVGTATPFSGEGIKGLPEGTADRRAVPVSFLTNPDGIHMELVPGVGIVGYRYEHHGTVSETDLRLVEVHLAKP